jgi:hypothetical protein
MRLSKAVIPLMLENVNEAKKKEEKAKGGVIINISLLQQLQDLQENLYTISPRLQLYR